MRNTIKTKLRNLRNWLLRHRTAYAVLSGSHAFAGFATGHPEVYWPMAMAYASLAWQADARH